MASYESRVAALDAAFVTASQNAHDTKESHEGARRAHEEAVEAQQRWREENVRSAGSKGATGPQ